jgi:uncharacterized membrane protein YbhN (UPF0104 family)
VLRDLQDVADVHTEDLDVPEELSRRKLRSRLLLALGLLIVVVAVVTLLPGLSGLRTRLAHASPGWLALGALLKLISGFGYVAVFRMTFCRRMSWRVSTQIGMSEFGANALLPTGGAGGLALGAWALKRGGMPGEEIAKRTVAFFLLTSLPNVIGVIVLGVALAVGVLGGESNLLLTALPAAIAAAAVAGTIGGGRLARRYEQRKRESGRHLRSKRALAAVKGLAALADGVDESLALLCEGNAILIAGLLAYLVFDVLILWAGFRALGSSPAIAILAMAYLIGELGGLIPIPGGLGGVDAGLLGTLVLYHVSITSAAGAVLAYRAVALSVPAVVGAIAFAALRRTLNTEAEQISVCAPDTEMHVIGVGRARINSRQRECAER